MGRVALFVVLVAVVGASTAPAIGNEPPLADAGLDQQVQRGETVLLDAAGSRDPDGTLARTTWRVEAPNGTAFEPRCWNCTRARFTASRLGVYNVSLTVTDDAGASRTDRLRVTVVRNPEPRVSLAGPDGLPVGDSGTYRARMAVPNGTLARAVWRVDGRRVAQRELSGARDADALRVPHPAVGRDRVQVTVHDAEGRTASATQVVRVYPMEPRPSSGGGGVTDPPTPTDRDTTTPSGPVPETPRPEQPQPTPTTSGPDGVPDVEINDAHRAVWLEPRDDPSSDDRGTAMPTGLGPGAGASGFVRIGGGDEATEYVPVAAHTAQRVQGEGEAIGGPIQRHGIGAGNVTTGGFG